jgi:hypothetical protein
VTAAIEQLAAAMRSAGLRVPAGLDEEYVRANGPALALAIRRRFDDLCASAAALRRVPSSRRAAVAAGREADYLALGKLEAQRAALVQARASVFWIGGLPGDWPSDPCLGLEMRNVARGRQRPYEPNGTLEAIVNDASH